MTIVTQASHPRLFKAFETISHDRGSGAGHSNYYVPPRWEGHLAQVEQQLTTLNDDELETFSIGERDEAKPLTVKLSEANTLLESFFNDWYDD
jgi:hypothetical protein